MSLRLSILDQSPITAADAVAATIALAGALTNSATHSQLPEIVSVARTIKRHFENIVTYIRKPITNATSEGLNSKIQMLKYRAHGYRNEDRFEAAIPFHRGGLDLYPTHSNC